MLCENCGHPITDIDKTDQIETDTYIVVWYDGKCPICGTYQSWHTHFEKTETEIDNVLSPHG